MKIGIDVRELGIAKTGIKTVIEGIVNQIELNDYGHTFVFFRPRKVVFRRKGILKILNHFNFYLWKEVILPFKAWSIDCDVLFCTDYVVPYFKFGMKTFVVFNDSTFWEYPQFYNKYWRILLNTIGIPAAHKANKIIAISQYSKKAIVRYVGFSEKEIEVVYLGAKNTQLFTNVTDNLSVNVMNKFNITKKKYLLHVGVFEKRKNLPNLIKAFSFVKGKHNDLKLVLVGQNGQSKDFDDSELIKKTIVSLNLENDVILTGYLIDSEISCLYKGALLYVFPSFKEGFGIPILEAFMNKIPVVSSNAAVLPEVVGDAGILFNPFEINDIEEKLLLVIENSELRSKLILLGAERLKHFNWDITVRRLISIFLNS